METDRDRPSPRVRALIERLKTEAVPKIEGVTLPIVRVAGDKFKLDRSGVLVRIGDDHFILTAAHELNTRIEDNVPLCVALRRGNPPFVTILDSEFHGTEKDIRDVAAIRLTPPEAEGILAERQAITVNSILRGERHSQAGLYLILGYPQLWFEVLPEGFSPTPLAFLSKPFQPSRDLIAELARDENYGMGYDPKLHGLFVLNREAKATTTWNSVTLPDFKGMQGISGCGIWRVCDNSPEAIENWTPDQCKLVAIQHRYDQSNAFIHTTWIDVLVQRLLASYPQLAGTLGLPGT